MENNTDTGFRNKTRFLGQHPDAPFYTQIKKFTQFFRDRSELHYHDYPECGICLTGNGVFFVEDRVYQFGPGTVTYFPAGMLHIAASPSENPSTWQYLWFDAKKLDIRLPECEVVTQDSDLRTLCTMLYTEAGKADAADITYFGLLVKAAARKFILCSDSSAAGGTSSSRDLIMPAIRMISENFGDDIRTSELAAACNISEATFRRAFRNITGETPLSYLNRIRITMAESLLENTDLSILDIAIRCGFPVLSTFNRQFMETAGVTPTQYRKNARIITKQAENSV